MAHKEQRNNRERKKPKQDKNKKDATPSGSIFSQSKSKPGAQIPPQPQSGKNTT